MTDDNYSVNRADDIYMKKLNDTKNTLESFKKKIALLESTTEAIDFAVELINREIDIVMWVNEITKIGEGADGNSN